MEATMDVAQREAELLAEMDEIAAYIGRKVLEFNGIDPDNVTVADFEGREGLRMAAECCGAIERRKLTTADRVAEALQDPRLWCELSEATRERCRRRGAQIAYAVYTDDGIIQVPPESEVLVKRLTTVIGDPVEAAKYLCKARMDATDAELLARDAGRCSKDEEAWNREYASQAAWPVTEEEIERVDAFFHDGQPFTMKRLEAADAAKEEGVTDVSAYLAGSVTRQ